MTRREMSGTVRIVKQVGEYEGISLDPEASDGLFEPYHYETWRGAISNETYVKDIRNRTFTYRNVSLDSLAEVYNREINLLREQRRIRQLNEAQLREPHCPPGAAPSNSRARHSRDNRRRRLRLQRMKQQQADN